MSEPIRALRHGSLARTSITGLLYNWGFFTILGYAPFLMHLSALKLGEVFCCWGVLVAVCAVFAAPRLKARVGTTASLTASLIFIAALLATIGVFPSDRWVVIGATIASGAAIGLNNTLVTTAVMSISPVPRNVASASYGFVRFIGGGLAPYVAGRLVESFNAHVPFLIAAAVVLGGAVMALSLRSPLALADRGADHGTDRRVTPAAPLSSSSSVQATAATSMGTSSPGTDDAIEALEEVLGDPVEAILGEEALRRRP